MQNKNGPLLRRPMTLFSPIADVGLALVLILGSISIGYTGIRWIYPPLKSWKGWKRMAAGALIGMSWSIAVVGTFAPTQTSTTFPLAALVEFFGFMGMGLILVMGITALSTRVAHRVLVHGMSVPQAMTQTPSRGEESERSYNAQLGKNQPEKNNPRTPTYAKTVPASVMEEPVLENDVMSVLRDEEESKKPAKKAQAIELDEPKSPMSELNDFAGFEDTLAQLKRDLKDFNESMSKTHKNGA